VTKALILGGARSGKSAYAEQLARQSGLPVLYIATGAGEDEEMKSRIAHHIQQRDPAWQTIEERIEIAKIVTDQRWQGHIILIDCLTLWISNLMTGGMEEQVGQRRQELVAAVEESKASIIMVSNEVGLGIVPMHPVGRRYRDEVGWTHQALARICDRVMFMTAGLPMMLKPPA
jgi:adenosylcobinamide kinase / adenosylcobinamide-phosphate guanylyltransferase